MHRLRLPSLKAPHLCHLRQETMRLLQREVHLKWQACLLLFKRCNMPQPEPRKPQGAARCSEDNPMTTFTLTASTLIATTQGRRVELQRVNEETRYQALRSMGISEGRAKAVASGLATMKGGK